ncbi:MAG TPA: AAA family ATPase [Chthoniobacterales bacterium]|nr:AAA family ATPase [Chthoniobacterales bacterium]
MNEFPVRQIPLPPSTKYPLGFSLPLNDRVLVVIGANGSGKTRFGAWLDEKDITANRRVSAHRSLTFPDRVQPTDLEDAERQLRIGHVSTVNDSGFWRSQRWQDNPAIALLNDFKHLVTLLVSESFSVSDKYRVSMRHGKAEQYIAPQETRLDIVKEIWEMVLPARELVVDGARVEARGRGKAVAYHAKEMSDGERGIFYLIAEALSVPKDGLFIIDEPELHLHRAIQARLWDAIERARPDCTFVYITHDLGFAASRRDATKIWLREYSEGKWEWEAVPQTDVMPESLLLEVMGSREPVRFVEGDQSSLDPFIYGLIFPGESVVPCGSCELVIHSTTSFAKLAALHHNICRGVVDHDGRSAADISMLRGLGVAVLDVAQVENLFLLESVLRVAATRLSLPPEETVRQVQERVFAQLDKDRVRIVSNLTRQEMELLVRRIGKSGDGARALTTALANACAAIDPATIYARWDKEIGRVLTERDYPAALRFYKTKGLASQTATPIFGVKSFQEQVMRWLRDTDSEPFVAAMRAAVPSI